VYNELVDFNFSVVDNSTLAMDFTRHPGNPAKQGKYAAIGCLVGNEMKAYMMQRYSARVIHADGSKRGPEHVVVALDYHSQVNFTRKLVDMCATRGCHVHVFNKNASCDTYVGWDVTCESSGPNLGRDSASALQYVVNHYDELPPTVFFVPTSNKWDRLGRLESLLDGADESTFDCLNDDNRTAVWQRPRLMAYQNCLVHHGFLNESVVNGPGWPNVTLDMPPSEIYWVLSLMASAFVIKGPSALTAAGKACQLPDELTDYWPYVDMKIFLDVIKHPNKSFDGVDCDGTNRQKLGVMFLSDCGSFRADTWEGMPMPHASPRPLSAWYDQRVGSFEADSARNLNACFNLVFKTTATNIRRRSKESYESILADVTVGESTEGIHYVEHTVPGIFGAGLADPYNHYCSSTSCVRGACMAHQSGQTAAER